MKIHDLQVIKYVCFNEQTNVSCLVKKTHENIVRDAQ